jgi:hypothetical protein
MPENQVAFQVISNIEQYACVMIYIIDSCLIVGQYIFMRKISLGCYIMYSHGRIAPCIIL